MIGFMINKIGYRYVWISISMIVGIAACYALGTLWFIVSTHTGLAEALMLCVVPFLIGDAIKIVIGTVLVKKLYMLV